jgi:hypothetical protein
MRLHDCSERKPSSLKILPVPLHHVSIADYIDLGRAEFARKT